MNDDHEMPRWLMTLVMVAAFLAVLLDLYVWRN